MKKEFTLILLLILVFTISTRVLADPPDVRIDKDSPLEVEYMSGDTQEINSLTTEGTESEYAVFKVGNDTILNILGNNGIISINRSKISAIGGGQISAKALTVTDTDDTLNSTEVYASGEGSLISISGDVNMTGKDGYNPTSLYAIDKGTFIIEGSIDATKFSEIYSKNGGVFTVSEDAEFTEEAQIYASGEESFLEVKGALAIKGTSNPMVENTNIFVRDGGRVEVGELSVEARGRAVATAEGIFVVKGDAYVKGGIKGYDVSVLSASEGGNFRVEGNIYVSDNATAAAEIVSGGYEYAYFTVAGEANVTTEGMVYALGGGTFTTQSAHLNGDGNLYLFKGSYFNIGNNVDTTLEDKEGNIYIWDDGILKSTGENLAIAAGTVVNINLNEGDGLFVNYGLLQLDFDDADLANLKISGYYQQKSQGTLEISIKDNTPTVVEVVETATIEEGAKLKVNIIDEINLLDKFVFLQAEGGVIGADNFVVTYSGTILGNKYPIAAGSTGTDDGKSIYVEFEDIDIGDVDWTFNVNGQNNLENMQKIYDITDTGAGVNGIIELITGLYGYEDGKEYMNEALNSLTGEIHAETLNLGSKNLSEYAFDILNLKQRGLNISPVFEIQNIDGDRNATGYNMVYLSFISDYMRTSNNYSIGALLSVGIGNLERKDISYLDVGKSMGIQVALYGKLKIRNSAVKGYFEYGAQKVNVNRENVIKNGTDGYFAKTRSKYNVNHLNVALELVLLDKMQVLMPVLGIELNRTTRQAFTESKYYTENTGHDGFVSDLFVDDYARNQCYIKIGLRYIKDSDKTNLSLGVFYKRNLSDILPIKVSYIDQEETFDVYGVNYGKNILFASVKLEQKFLQNTWGFFSYSGEFRKYSRLHKLLLGVKIVF